jgi:hypothetical protein
LEEGIGEMVGLTVARISSSTSSASRNKGKFGASWGSPNLSASSLLSLSSAVAADYQH